MRVSLKTRPQQATPNELSAVAARLVEAACRARDGDREAARAHIAHAVALLQQAPSVEPTAARLAARPTAQIGADAVEKTSQPRACAGSSSPQLDHIRLRRVLDYISANIDDDLTLAVLAKIAGYSQFHFARKFALTVGVSPYRYVSRMRLERAMAELASGQSPVAEIALNAHFSSQASFTRAFHRAIGMTPKKYQRSRLYRGKPGSAPGSRSFANVATSADLDGEERGAVLGGNALTLFPHLGRLRRVR